MKDLNKVKRQKMIKKIQVDIAYDCILEMNEIPVKLLKVLI